METGRPWQAGSVSIVVNIGIGTGLGICNIYAHKQRVVSRERRRQY